MQSCVEQYQSFDSKLRHHASTSQWLCPCCCPCRRYYQSFFDNGAITILMEFMDAGSLAHVLQRVPRWDEPHIAALAYQVCLAALRFRDVQTKL